MKDKYGWIKKLTKGGQSEDKSGKTKYLDEEKMKEVEKSLKKKRGFSKLFNKLFGE